MVTSLFFFDCVGRECHVSLIVPTDIHFGLLTWDSSNLNSENFYKINFFMWAIGKGHRYLGRERQIVPTFRWGPKDVTYFGELELAI